jgi:hypothetical protein
LKVVPDHTRDLALEILDAEAVVDMNDVVELEIYSPSVFPPVTMGTDLQDPRCRLSRRHDSAVSALS